MSFFQAIFLGALQGLTEFIPVSSSGHLVIAQSLLPNFSQPGVLFDAALHAGTMLAIIFYFRRRILTFNKNMLLLLFVGSIPAAFIGLLFQKQLENLFLSLRVVGVALLATGAMNWMVDRASAIQNSKFGWPQALIVGMFQAVAIIPGISRSGSTIFAAIAQGIKKEDAVAFSFLLSVPVVAGAVGLQLFTHSDFTQAQVTNYLLGFLTSFLVGYVSIGIVISALLSHRFKLFAVYCFLAGLTTLSLSL